MTDDTRRNINSFLGSKSAAHDPSAPRGIMGILSLIIGGALIYTSLPYAGAFVDVGEIVSVSHVDRGFGKLTANLTKTAPVKKVYMRAGQSLEAQYTLPENSTLTLSVMRCQNRPILEAWSCNPVSKRDILIKDGKAGSKTIKAPQAGFYYFTDTMTMPKSMQAPYTLVWRRTS